MLSFSKYIFILSFSAIILVGCGGADERKAAYLEKAKQSIAAGSFDKARIELKNVLQIDPKHAEAYFELGKIFEAQKEFQKAYGNYAKSAELAPDNYSSQAKLGYFLLIFFKDEDKAKEKMDLILSKEPDNIEGLLLKARILASGKKIEEATTLSKEIFQSNPEYAENALLLATLHVMDKKNDDAILVLERSLESNKANENISQLLAKIYILNKDNDKAELIFKQAIESNPNLFKNYANLALFYNSIKEEAKAESVLRDAIANNPDDVERQLSLARYIKDVRGNVAAINEVKALIQNKPRAGELRTALGSLYLLENDIEKAKKVYTQAISDFSEEATGIESRISLAAIYVKDNEYDKAKKQVEDAIAISPNDPNVNLLKAKLALQDKDYEMAIISLRIVIKESPDKIEAYLLLAATHAAQNEEEQAKVVMTSAHENNRSNAEALLTLAKYYAKANDAVQTEKIIDDYLILNDTDYEALSIKVALLNNQKKFDDAKPLAIKMVELYPNKANGYVYSIPYLAQAKDRDNAIALLKDGYSKVEDNKLILKLLTSMQIAAGQIEEAKQRVNAAIAKSPEDPEVHLVLVRIYLATNDTVNTERKLIEINNNFPNNENAYILLADFYKKAGNDSAYLRVLKEGTKNVPKSYKLSLSLARVYELNKQFNDSIEVYEQLILSYPNNVIVANNLASMLSDHRSDEKSLNRAKELADRLNKSDQPVILDTVGWVYYKTGHYNEAIDALKVVVEKEPKINIFNYHLGMAYKAYGDKDAAKVYLERSLADGKDFNGKLEAEKALSSL